MRRLSAILLTALALAGCGKPTVVNSPSDSPSPTPAETPRIILTIPHTETPTPSPTPERIPELPRKPVDTVKLFNGITLNSKFETPATDELASLERTQDDAYRVQIIFTAKLPRPSRTLEDLAANDPKLPETLKGLPQLLTSGSVSPYYDKLYRNKVNNLRDRINRLDVVLSRHNFYDCETMLELKSPDTGRKALLMQGDMDINTDGSDGDRNYPVDATSSTFQPQTSYRWPKQTNRPNLCLPIFESKLASLKAEYASKGLSAERNRELRQSIEATARTVNDLKSGSFLVSGADPSIVVPGFMLKDSSNPYSPSIGDYAAVIYDGKVYPAIVGDAGPSDKMGEASLRIGREINPKASSNIRAVNNIKAAYLIFPGTAESKFGPPDVVAWTEKCKQYLEEIGGITPEIHAWTDIVPAWPTPTPTPTPTPLPSPISSPSPITNGPTSTITPTPAPSATPTPLPSQAPPEIQTTLPTELPASPGTNSTLPKP
ncbi:hypothetical protein BH09VER1_BH09VER1_21360 [soil metagenome]